MSATAFSGPLVIFGQSPYTGQEYNGDRAPAILDMGQALLDPRLPFTYLPGQTSSQDFRGFLSGGAYVVLDATPSALSAVNLAAAQVPVAGTALTLAAGTGITSGVSLVRADTGATVTVRAIDGAHTPLKVGQNQSFGFWDPAKMLGRNLRITSVGNDSAATFLCVGYDKFGYPMSELITGANAGIASGVKAFGYLVSITPAGTLSGSNVSVGTGDVFGLPLRCDSFFQADIYWNNAKITANTGFTAAVTTTPTTTTGDVRGTYAVQSASDGTKKLQVRINLSPALMAVSSLSALMEGLFGKVQA